MVYDTDTETGQTYVLGIHLGASSQHVGILDPSGKVLAEQSLREPPHIREERPYQDILKRACSDICSVIAQAEKNGVQRADIVGAGVIVPAPVDTERGFVQRAPSLRGFEDVYIGHDLQQRLVAETALDIPFFVESSGRGYALMESYLGGQSGVRSFVTVFLGTGLGGGLMLDGTLYHGHTNMAGEIGHIVIHPNGRQCPCGSRGCLETVASGLGLLRDTKLTKSPLASRNDLHYLDLVDAARAGDMEIRDLFATMGRNLGIGIASIINLLNPAKVILTGKLANAAEYFLPDVQIELRNRAFLGMGCSVEVSRLLEHSELRAALSTYLYYGKDLKR